MPGRKRPYIYSYRSSSSPQSASGGASGAGQVSATLQPEIVRRFQNVLSGRMNTITLSPQLRVHEQRALVAQALGIIMSDQYFLWILHSLAYRKALHMLLGTPCTSYAFLRCEPDIDLDGIVFTRRELFSVFDQKVLWQRDARGQMKRTYVGGRPVLMASSAALASVGGSSMVSWLVRALLMGKNFPRYAAQRRMHLPTAVRGCKEVLARRLWGMCRRIKVIFYHASYCFEMSQHASGDVFGGSGLLQYHRVCPSLNQIRPQSSQLSPCPGQHRAGS